MQWAKINVCTISFSLRVFHPNKYLQQTLKSLRKSIQPYLRSLKKLNKFVIIVILIHFHSGKRQFSDVYIFPDIFFAWRLFVDWRTWWKSLTCLSTPWPLIRTWTTRSRWKSALRSVFTLNLNITNLSECHLLIYLKLVLFFDNVVGLGYF